MKDNITYYNHVYISTNIKIIMYIQVQTTKLKILHKTSVASKKCFSSGNKFGCNTYKVEFLRPLYKYALA